MKRDLDAVIREALNNGRNGDIDIARAAYNAGVEDAAAACEDNVRKFSGEHSAASLACAVAIRALRID